MTESTRVVPLTCHGHSRPVTHISFSQLSPSAITQTSASPPPEEEPYYIISACKDNNPMLRDGQTGDWIGTFLGHKGAVWSARLSSCSSLAATASADFTAKIWNTFTGQCIHSLEHNHIVRCVAFPPQENPLILATGGNEKKLRIWDFSGGEGVAPKSFEVGAGQHGGTIKSIVWDRGDSNILITACDDGVIRWWDLRQYTTPVASYEVKDGIGSMEYESLPLSSTSPSTASKGILSIAAGKSIHFFSGTNLIKKITLQQEVASVALNGPARKFVTGHPGDTWVRVWDFDSEKELEVGKGHHGPVWSVAFSPDGKLYATGSEDGTIKLWKFTRGAFGLWR